MESTPHDETADRRAATDEALVAALAIGRSYADAAGLVGLSARTVLRRMQDPLFAAEVAARRRLHLGSIAGQLVGESEAAVAVVRAIMNEAERPSDRLRAALAMLQHAHAFHEAEDLGRVMNDVVDRLAQLEAEAAR